MGAITPATTVPNGCDNGRAKTLYYFSSITSGDTFVTGLSKIFKATLLGSADIPVTESSGTLTFGGGSGATAWVEVEHSGY